nr:hypothetical protein [Tanacetum cinerariifolium]
MILEFVENGPLLWPTVEEDGVTRLKKYFELSAAEAIQADCDVKKLRDDQKCMKKVEPSSRSKAIEDIISIRSFVEALVLNHYVLVRKM